MGVVAGIYTIFALGLQLQFGFTGLLNFGHVAFMAIGAYTMAILVVKAGLAMWAAAPLAIVAAAAFGLLLGPADPAPACRLPRDRDDRVRRDRPLRRDQRAAPDGRASGTINIAGAGAAASYNAEWIAFQRTVQDGSRA